MKPTLKTELLPLLMVVISIALGVYFYSVFPEQVPIHWNVYGEVDNWGSKLTGAIMGPAMVIGIYLLFLIIPLIDPRKEKYSEFSKPFNVFKILLMLLMLGIYLIASLSSLGYNLRVEVWIPSLIGVMFVLMGNYMGKIKPNWFMGIRTPWTLSNDEVWNKTHRLGGKMFVVLGLYLLLSPLLPPQYTFLAMLILVIGMVIVSTVYSYVLYKKLKK
ncbi:MAG: SdpI family protein [Candidatus Komeilibacteria bacterium]|nr:SdpI family protein [Candidatus Komeilibacteria bacterium]